MKASEQKDIMIPFVQNILKKLGFTCKHEFEISFRKKTEYGGIKMNFHFSDAGYSGNNLFSISHNQVEDIMLEIGHPNNNLEHVKAGKDLLYTVKDKKTKYTYLNEPVKVGSGNKNRIESIKDLEIWKVEFANYVSTDGNNFITNFSSLKNIHEHLDEKFRNSEHNYLDLLLGGTDHLFRFLIISKMYDDSNFPNKLRYVEKRIVKEKWIPYFEKLKVKLKDG